MLAFPVSSSVCRLVGCSCILIRMQKGSTPGQRSSACRGSFAALPRSLRRFVADNLPALSMPEVAVSIDNHPDVLKLPEPGGDVEVLAEGGITGIWRSSTVNSLRSWDRCVVPDLTSPFLRRNGSCVRQKSDPT